MGVRSRSPSLALLCVPALLFQPPGIPRDLAPGIAEKQVLLLPRGSGGGERDPGLLPRSPPTEAGQTFLHFVNAWLLSLMSLEMRLS